MKNLTIICFSIVLLSACNSEITSEDNSSTSQLDDNPSNTSIVNMEWSGCYSFIEEGDESHSYYLRLDCKDTLAYGSMIEEIEAPNIRESVSGEIKGIVRDSTIISTYTYNTEEGSKSRVEIFKMNADKTLSRKITTEDSPTSAQLFKVVSCDDFPKAQVEQ